MQNKSQFLVIFGAAFACFLWSTAFLGIKIGLQYTKPLSFAGIRFIISGLLLIPFCGNFKYYRETIATHWKTIATISFFQTFLLYTFFYTGMTVVPGAISAIIIGSSPLFSAITAHFAFRNDKLNSKKIVSISLGLAGVATIALFKKPIPNQAPIALWGIIILILSAISSSIGNILVSKMKSKINPFVLTSAQIGLGGILLLLLSFPLEGVPDFIQPLPYYLSLIWLSTLSAIAFSIWFYLLQKPGVKISELNLWKFIIPVSGALLSWIFLPDESPTVFALVGMGLISGGVVFYFWPSNTIKQ